jgi:hypothetical protein
MYVIVIAMPGSRGRRASNWFIRRSGGAYVCRDVNAKNHRCCVYRVTHYLLFFDVVIRTIRLIAGSRMDEQLTDSLLNPAAW